MACLQPFLEQRVPHLQEQTRSQYKAHSTDNFEKYKEVCLNQYCAITPKSFVLT